MTPEEIDQPTALAIYDDIMIHGKQWLEVAGDYDMSVADVMRVFDDALEQMELRLKTRSEACKDIVNKQLINAISMAREGLEKSRLPKIKTVNKVTSGGEDGPFETNETHTEPHEAGDPRWLGQLLAAIKQFSDLNVRALPKEIEIDIKSQHEIRLVTSMTDEELLEKAALHHAKEAGIIEVDPSDFKNITGT